MPSYPRPPPPRPTLTSVNPVRRRARGARGARQRPSPRCAARRPSGRRGRSPCRCRPPPPAARAPACRRPPRTTPPRPPRARRRASGRGTPAALPLLRGCGLGAGAHEVLDRARWLRAALDPVVVALFVDDERGGLRLRVVVPDRLDEAAIARRALVGHDHAPDRVLLAAHSREPDSYAHMTATG